MVISRACRQRTPDGLPDCAIPLSAEQSHCFTPIRHAAGPSRNSRAKPASHAPSLQRVSCVSSAVRRCNISRDGACNSQRDCLPTGRIRSQRSRGRSGTSLRRRSVAASRGSRASRHLGGAQVGGFEETVPGERPSFNAGSDLQSLPRNLRVNAHAGSPSRKGHSQLGDAGATPGLRPLPQPLAPSRAAGSFTDPL